jgi:adenylate cyclase
VAIVGIGLCLFYATVSVQVPLRDVTPFFGALVLAPVVLIFLLVLVLLQRNLGSVTLLGCVIVAMLAALFFSYPHVLYRTMHDSSLSPAFILKSIQVVFGPVLIAFVALTLRPALAVAATVAFVGLHAVNIWIVVADPRTVVTDDTVAGLMGPDLLLPRAIADMSILAIAGAIAIVATLAARRTVRRAVTLERANSHLRRYFSPDVAERLAQSGTPATEAGGSLHEVVILFSDIENFTTIAQDLSPNETVALLSEYREEMVATIFLHNGTVDKFIGDGILAAFGTFEATPDAADRAFLTALAMFRALDRMNLQRGAAGLPLLRHRVGLHAGPALVGNVAAAGRMEFTIIGDAVNVASRIEKSGKRLGQGLLLSAAVRDRLSDARKLQPLGVVALPGHSRPVELFTVDQVHA